MLKKIKYDSIIFDLDGTLWDAANVTAIGWNNALIKNDLSKYKVNTQDVRKVSGMPIRECVEFLFRDIPTIDLTEFGKIICIEEEKAFEECCGQLYPGVQNGIEVLAKKYPLFLVSNCQSWYLSKFWKQFDLEKYFTGQDCNGNANEPKPKMIKGLLKKFHLRNAIYIGDTRGDRTACMEAGVTFGYASYGFGNIEKENITLNNFNELVKCLM